MLNGRFVAAGKDVTVFVGGEVVAGASGSVRRSGASYLMRIDYATPKGLRFLCPSLECQVRKTRVNVTVPPANGRLRGAVPQRAALTGYDRSSMKSFDAVGVERSAGFGD